MTDVLVVVGFVALTTLVVIWAWFGG